MGVTFLTNEDKAILDQNITELSEEMAKLKEEGDAGVAVDTTLTESGKAADAKTVGDELKTAIKGEMVSGINLFNKNTITRGYYVRSQTGELEENANFCASDFIAVKPNTIYTATAISNSCMYDSAKKRLTYIATSTFTTSADTAFIRITLANNDGDAQINSFMLVEGDTLPSTYYPYNDDGDVVLKIDSFNHKPLVSALKEKLGVSSAGNTIDKLRKHLKNPFVRTQIKLTGDSITAGAGGTGYSATGEHMFDNEYANVLTATCWSNMLYHYINKRFNRDVIVPPNDDNIVYFMEGVSFTSISYYQCTTWKAAVFKNTSALGKACVFDCYGDHIGIYYTASADSGILNVYVDDVLKTSIDAYSTTTTYRNKCLVENLGAGKHTLRIDATGTKNASSTGYGVKVEGYLLHKEAIVKPWGLSGSSSHAGNTQKEKLYSKDDDFVLMQYGTNDRHVSMTEEWTTEMLVEIATYMRDVVGVEPILMASCPSSVEFESDDVPEVGVTRHYHMWDVKLAVQKAAEILGAPFIDNYDAFWQYCETHDVGIDALLADGLHPNDLGYEVMFKNIMRALGLPLVPSEYDDIVADY